MPGGGGRYQESLTPEQQAEAARAAYGTSPFKATYDQVEALRQQYTSGGGRNREFNSVGFDNAVAALNAQAMQNYLASDSIKSLMSDKSITPQYAQVDSPHGGMRDDKSNITGFVRDNHDGTYTQFDTAGKQGATYRPSSGGGFLGDIGGFIGGLGEAATGIVHGVGQAASDIASTPLGKAAILGGLAIATGGFSAAGAAAAGEGAAASGAAGALGMNAGLAANAVNAGVMNAGINLASGGNLDSALKAGVTGAALSGVGGWASGAAKDAVSGLDLGKDVTNAIGNVASGAATGGTSAALQGKDIGQGILSGATNGIANTAGNYIGGQVKDLTGSDTLAGAASGGTSALLTGKNVGQGIIAGGIDAATGIGGAGALTNTILNKPSTPPAPEPINTPVSAAPAEPLPSGVIGNYLDWFNQGRAHAKGA